MLFSKKKKVPSACPQTGKSAGFFRKYPWLIWLFPVVGLASLIWFLVRVVPKPSRAAYPCQRVAFPFASAFIIWLMGLGGSTATLRKAKSSFLRSRYLIGIFCMVASIGFVWLSLTLTAKKEAKAAEPHSANSPIGVAKGLHPGRVVWVHDPNATDWKGPSMGDGYWWQSNHTNQEVVDRMIFQAIRELAGVSNISEAWDALFRYFNQQHGKPDVGYKSGEKIMIKVNFVDMIASGGNTNYNLINHTPEYAICSPQIIHSLLDHLVNIVGVAQSDITIGDPICLWCNEFYNMIHPDFPNVHYLDYLGYYNRTKIKYSTVPFYWSTSKAAGKTQDYVLQSYADVEYFINLASLKGHYNVAGITLCGKNHYGSLRQPNAGGYYDMHSDGPYSVPQSGKYRNMVDLMGHRDVGGKTFLCMIDGLYGGKHALSYPQNLPRKWQMAPFNNDWPSSIFVSQDQVALDSVGFDFLIAEWPESNGPAHAATDDYLHEAALANNPPSGTFYDPEKDGTRLASLGAHEHWNNPTDKQYSRNSGTGNGIELWQVSLTPDVDFNGDGKVDFKDFSIFAQYLFQDKSWVDIAPHPFGNGIVDYDDLAVLAESWLAFPGLVSYWKLDETEGTIAHDSISNKHGNLNGNPIWQPESGKIDGALHFDGIDDYISTPFILNPAGVPFTAFAWVKGGSPGQVVISQQSSILVPRGKDWLCADPLAGKLMTALTDGNPSTFPLVSEFIVIDGDWHCIGVAWDGSRRSLYADESEVAKDTSSLANLISADTGLCIGAGKTLTAGTFWSGLIDDVRIYDREVKP
jgi:hypothetical protein